MFRIAVFTGSLSHHVRRTIEHLLREQPDVEALILLHRPKRRLKRLVRNQLRNLKRHGWRWIPYQLSEIYGRMRRPRRETAWQVPDNVTLVQVDAINSPSTVGILRAFAADLGLSLAAPILKPAVFEAPRLGTINIHKGRLPHYRGMPPAFWELWTGEQEVGVTVHQVEAGLDTGAIVLEAAIPVEKFSTPGGLRVRLDEIGVKLIIQAVSEIRDGTAAFVAQENGGATNTRPTLSQERELKLRTDPIGPARTAKNFVFSSYSAIRGYDSNRIVVLLYHRVSDALRDSVTIGVEQFDRHMQFLSDHAHLVDLHALIRGDIPSEGPIVAVTFDDGYRDNYENAAPVLIKHKIPVTFFVSTGKITRDEPFDHDLRKLGRGLPNMRWHEIREMQAEGLSFGSHTVNHINLAQSAPSLVDSELTESRDVLRRELGTEDIMFAYPFGKRADITPDALERIKRAGYVANCSAYGGVNPRSVDRWDIRRQGVDHTFDIAALKAKLAGWKATQHV